MVFASCLSNMITINHKYLNFYFSFIEFYSHQRNYYLFSDGNCPEQSGYNNYASGGCTGHNELGIHQLSRNDCAYRCDQEPTCLSYEYKKRGKPKVKRCQLSSSCIYDLTVKNASNPFCFYEKQGNRLL